MNNSYEASILAVDDTPDNLFLLENVLNGYEHYTVQLAENGAAALAIVEQAPPDLILLDVMMPGINGYEVARRIRQNESLPYIPILLLTAHDQSSLVEGLDAGADDFLRKPFDVDELLARVRSMLRLKRSIDAYRHMVKQRDDFMARLTHDLRTPLVASNRVLALCLENTFGEISKDAQDALDNVITNNNNLLKMVNTLLEVYRHDAGQKQLTLSQLCLRTLCEEIVQELSPLAHEKSLTLTLETEADTDGLVSKPHQMGQKPFDPAQYMIKGDHIELRRLVTNLVGNAIKFTDSGHVVVYIRSHADQTIHLEVEDTGPGISEADQSQIFEWFRQGDHLRAGSGLGLHLAQRIARLHGGQITASSTLGKGSVFKLVLPQLPIRQFSTLSA